MNSEYGFKELRVKQDYQKTIDANDLDVTVDYDSAI